MEWNDLESRLTTRGAGGLDDLAATLSQLDEQRRRALSKPLTAFVRSWWKDVNESRHLHPESGIDPDARQRLQTAVDNVEAVRLAVVGVTTGAAAVATWLRQEAESFHTAWHNFPRGDQTTASRVRTDRLNRVLHSRADAWVLDLFESLSAKLRYRGSSEWRDYVVAKTSELGIAPPITPGFVECWIARYINYAEVTYDERLDRMRADALLPSMLDALFALDGLGHHFEIYLWTDHDKRALPTYLNSLLEHGDTDRGVLIDGCLRRLLRGGRPGDLRPYRKLLEDLAPTPAETAARARDFAVLLPDSAAAVAGYAQKALRAADTAGLLTGELLVEISQKVLPRPERKLVRDQLSWIDKAIGRHPEQRCELVTEVVTAFGHESADVQTRAVGFVVAHAATLSDDDRALIAATASDLPSDARERLSRVVELEPVSPTHTDTTMLLPQRRPDPEPITTVAELAERLAGLRGMLRTDPHGETLDAVAVEPVLEALVEFTARDRQSLAVALKPVLSEINVISPQWYTGVNVRLLDGVMYAAARATGDAHPIDIDAAIIYGHEVPDEQRTPDRSTRAARWRKGLARMSGPERVLAHRLAELALRIADDPVPPPLSTPTDAIGRVQPSTVITRVQRAEREGRPPWEFDLQQALLRLPEEATADEIARAEALTSPAGRRLADWLAGRNRPEITVSGRSMTMYHRYGDEDEEIELPLARVSVWQPEPVHHGDTVQLLDQLRLVLMPRVKEGDLTVQRPDWPRAWSAIVPGRREVAAAHLLRMLGPEAYWDTIQPMEERYYLSMLPDLAEADDTNASALITCIGFGLNTPAAGERAHVVEAATILAARDQLDGEALGAVTARLVLDGLGKCTRVATALRELADAGAVPQVWRTLTALLPPLLRPDTAPNRASDLMELAGRVAESIEARGEIPAVAAVAARRGSSKLVTGANRLHKYLTR